MAKAVHGEAREEYIGKVAVAAVILNRVKSPCFPILLRKSFISREHLPVWKTAR